MPRGDNSKKPVATPVETDKLCNYNCGQEAKYKFTNGKLCCSIHHNSCPGKRKQFSDRTDHKENAAKSLATRVRLGITKSSQINGGKTRRESGHYERLGKTMQKHWAENPWSNNLQCPILPYKETSLIYQGTYELAFIEQLETKHGLEWVKANVRRGPSIWYDDPQGNERLYISDFIINNTIYEIKSGWTWNHAGNDTLLENLNKAKLTKCTELGYNVILVLNGEEIKWQQ